MSPDLAAAESLLAFWADCGVESLYADQPINRMRADAASPALGPTPPQVKATAVRPISLAATPPPVDMEEARANAAAAGNLAELAQAIAAFDGCALKHAGARQSVFAG